MQALSSAQLLDVWERGRSQPPPVRALTLLAAVLPDAEPAALEETTVGARDAALLGLREATFGPLVIALTSCPACDEQVEAVFECSALRRDPDGTSDVRVPTCADLVAVAAEPDVESARLALLQRCVGQALEPDEVAERVQQIADADPQADVELALTCPACTHEWTAAFDIASFLWSELHARAERTLHDVHALASAYGWREDDVLALTPARRAAYLELVAG